MRKFIEDPQQLSLLDWAPPTSIDGLLSPEQIYNATDSKLFVTFPEDYRFDRKSAKVDPRQLAECLSAFGNSLKALGGVIAIGINDHGEIEGCANLPGTRIAELERFGHDMCPSGKFITRRQQVINKKGEADFIIIGRIYYVDDRLVELTNGEAFVRFSNQNRRLQDHEKQEIRINKGEVSFEQQKSGLKYPEDFKTNEVFKFLSYLRSTYGISIETSDFQILEMYHLGKREDGKFAPNNACAILFAKDPVQIFPGCKIHFLRYEGESEKSGSEYNVVKDRIISGTIFEQITQISDLLEANFREFTVFKENGKFFTVPEYPRDAWYELVVNACAHRSYNVRNAPIFIKMFDDHLLVESPGGFMPQVTPETIYEMHRPRNPFIMNVLREFGEVRCINEGTKRIRKEMAAASLPAPIFKQVDNNQMSFRAKLQNDIKHRKNSLDTEAYKILGEIVSFGLNEEERKIVNYIIEHNKINVSRALRILKTTRWHTAKELLENLVQRGILNYQAGKRQRDARAHYILNKKEDK